MSKSKTARKIRRTRKLHKRSDRRTTKQRLQLQLQLNELNS